MKTEGSPNQQDCINNFDESKRRIISDIDMGEGIGEAHDLDSYEKKIKSSENENRDLEFRTNKMTFFLEDNTTKH